MWPGLRVAAQLRRRPMPLTSCCNGYPNFYGVPQPESAADTVWSWIQDPAHEVRRLPADDSEGRSVGRARALPAVRPSLVRKRRLLPGRPLVNPRRRRAGAADAPAEELRRLAPRTSGVVRCITAYGN